MSTTFACEIINLVAIGKKKATQNILTFYLSFICSINYHHYSIPCREDYTKHYSLYKCKYCDTTLGPIFVRKQFKKELEEKNIQLQIPFFYDD